MNGSRIKSWAVAAGTAALFAAGLWTYGLPPARMVRPTGETAATADDLTTAPAGAAGRLLVTANNGALDTDPQRVAEQDLVRRHYERLHPRWSVRFTTWQFSPDSFFAKHLSNTLTDTIGVFATEAVLLADGHMAADITAEVEAWDLAPHLDRKLLQPITRDGRIYGLPNGGANSGFYVMALFYNVRLLKEAGLTDADGAVIPPQTWDDFTIYAVRLTDRARGQAGFGILGETGPAGWHFLNWVWQAGGDFEERDAEGNWRAVFDSPEAAAALGFIQDLRWKHDVLQRNVLASNDDLFQMFTSGRIAMAIFTPEYLHYLVDKYGMEFENIGICLLPEGPGGRANQIGGSYSILNRRLTGERKAAAFALLAAEYDLDLVEERMRLLHEQGRRVGIPCIPIFAPEYQDRLDAIVDKYRNVPDLSDLMREAASYVRLEPPVRAQALYNQYLSPAIQEVLVRRDANPQEILRAAARRFQIRELDPANERRREQAGLADAGS